jgi:hypothetical protein
LPPSCRCRQEGGRGTGPQAPERPISKFEAVLVTFAAGHQEVNILRDRNFDINSTLKTNGWPDERSSGKYGPNWLHNDMREVSYLYVHNLFDEYVQTGGLKIP